LPITATTGGKAKTAKKGKTAKTARMGRKAKTVHGKSQGNA
jgi:hypothetical protein